MCPEKLQKILDSNYAISRNIRTQWGAPERVTVATDSTSTQTQYVFLKGELAVTYAPCEESFSHSTAKINTHATKSLYTCHIICLKIYVI